MPFQPASQVIPDVLGALLAIRRRLRENSAMTQRMYEAICQVLEHMYLLPIEGSDEHDSFNFIVPNDSIYERMNTRLRRVERWVVQWPHRERIDHAFETFREVYQDFLVHVSNLQGEERRNAAQDYVNELEEFGSDSENDAEDHDETEEETDSVLTPPYEERPVQTNSRPASIPSHRRNRD